jgi:hypothetical protein
VTTAVNFHTSKHGGGDKSESMASCSSCLGGKKKNHGLTIKQISLFIPQPVTLLTELPVCWIMNNTHHMHNNTKREIKISISKSALKECHSLHTVCFSHILMTELSIDRTKSCASWKSKSWTGSPYIWSLTRKGLLDLMSYKSTCPVAVPTPSVRLPWNLSAVTDGKPSSLKKHNVFMNVTIRIKCLVMDHNYKQCFLQSRQISINVSWVSFLEVCNNSLYQNKIQQQQQQQWRPRPRWREIK